MNYLRMKEKMTETTKNILLHRIPFFVFTILIWGGSSIPSYDIPKVFELTPDKLIHFAEYLILGVFISRWIHFDFSHFSSLQKLILIVTIGSVVGAIDETWQSFIPGRTPDYRDWLMDVTGVLIAGLIFYFRKRKIQN